ncbi:hypothetical protein BH24DEI2_BH24DEI2_01590 [soil metagenome]
MKLSEGDNTSLELTVAGYEFPNLENEPYDSDWLYITIRVTHPRGSWTSTDPSLLTDEVAPLADWLEAIADVRTVESETGFIEPNLSFVLLEGDVRKVRVYFELESRPSWAAAAWAGLEDLWLEFAVVPDMLRDAAASLRSQSAKFPSRGGG